MRCHPISRGRPFGARARKSNSNPSLLTMSRRLRYIPPGGALVEITSRTMQGRLLLRPSPALNDVALGVLARTARLASVLVHAFAFLSNHYHLLVWVADAQQLAQFMNYLNSNLAREGGRIARWREKFVTPRPAPSCPAFEEIVERIALGGRLQRAS